ncbi:hypothetical protein V493_08185 [Pseudogymnoascus sp. VKM F-4281 (FW-2241)]|nr:hypothetical protein V493_08185 [Pseudogymnoascus sp. VKM F-4281 (FW-2241)]
MALDNPSNFSQQGSVDWVALSGGFLSISYGMLQRLSGSNLDPYTVSIGYVLGGQFRLSRSGKRNVTNALNNMKAYAGFQNVLYFGFGMKHPARKIAMIEQGVTLVALGATLSECFPFDTAAEILSDMVSLQSNLDMTPSVSEWLAVINSCSGILSTTVFPIRAEQLMGLGAEDKPADPTDIAKVLNAIGKITKNELVSITIHGGKEARWIGAIAEWLFDLTVTITNEGGEVVHTSCPSNQIAQVNICSVSRLEHWEKGYRKPETRIKALTITDTTFYIEAAAKFWSENDQMTSRYEKQCYGGTMSTPTMNGRVPWESCLSTVFGVLFKDLMKQPNCVAKAINAAARIYAAIAAAEEGVPTSVLETNVLYVELSFGATFIHNLLQCFPELSMIKPYLPQYSNAQTYDDAIKQYKMHLQEIRNSCSCILCKGRPTQSQQAAAARKQAEGTSDKAAAEAWEVNCQAVLIELILRLGRLLSVSDCVEGLCPKFTGLRKLYNMRGEEIKANSRNYTEPPGLHRYHKLDHQPPKSAEFVAMDNFPAHIEQALCLFTGHTSKDLKIDLSYSSAISADGICIYLHILREIPDSPPKFAMLHICPGQILFEGKKFTQLSDRRSYMDYVKKGDQEQDETLMTCAAQGLLTQVKLAVKQTVHQLFLNYDLFDNDGLGAGLHLPPYRVCERMLHNYRRVSCSHLSNSETDWGNDWGGYSIPELRTKFDFENRYKTWNMESTDLGRCAMVALYDEIMPTSSIAIVRDTECLSCCRQIWDKTMEVFRTGNILVINKPDPNRPLWKGL